MSVTERNEMIAVRKIDKMAFRYLSKAEIKWLRGKMNDCPPEVREAARSTNAGRFMSVMTMYQKAWRKTITSKPQSRTGNLYGH